MAGAFLSGQVFCQMDHEEVAAFAAGAEAQLTGELAVCAGSCGPGNLHLINGLFDCHRNHVPVLAIAAHIPSSEIGSGYFQETHPQELFRECSHYCELVSSPEQIPQVLECLLITGQDADYQLKVVVEDMDAFQTLLLNRITRIEGVTGVHSSFVLRHVVDRTSLPV